MVENYEEIRVGASPSPISMTDSAIKAIKAIFEEENDDTSHLRVFVTGGGCSGFQYGFAFEDAIEEDDSVFQFEGASLVVDSMSYQYLVGATIDYVTDQFQENFVIDNPIAKTQCGCGQSFSV